MSAATPATFSKEMRDGIHAVVGVVGVRAGGRCAPRSARSFANAASSAFIVATGASKDRRAAITVHTRSGFIGIIQVRVQYFC